jgi:hypothetical protein
MPILGQATGDVPADETGGACDEDLHALILLNYGSSLEYICLSVFNDIFYPGAK